MIHELHSNLVMVEAHGEKGGTILESQDAAGKIVIVSDKALQKRIKEDLLQLRASTNKCVAVKFVWA
jgi:hypothetical protein